MTVCGNQAWVSQCSPHRTPFRLHALTSRWSTRSPTLSICCLLILTAPGKNIKVLLSSCYIGGKKQHCPSPRAKALRITSSSQASLRLRAEPRALIFLFLSAELRWPFTLPFGPVSLSASKHNSSDARPSCGACLTACVGSDAEMVPALFMRASSVNDNMGRRLCTQMCMWRRGGARQWSCVVQNLWFIIFSYSIIMCLLAVNTLHEKCFLMFLHILPTEGYYC